MHVDLLGGLYKFRRRARALTLVQSGSGPLMVQRGKLT